MQGGKPRGPRGDPLLRSLRCREDGCAPDAGRRLRRHAQFTEALVRRLGLEHELEGHQGCVNCLQWTPDGRHLASGSDDTNVILWDPFRHKQLQVIPTFHIGNIFSVKFLGNGSSEIATAAGDCRVLVHSVQAAQTKSAPLLECSCHENRVKRLATSPIEPTLFWSAAEDGLVIQYDLREQHDCSLSHSKVLIDLSHNFGEVKCVAVNPTKPYYIAVGANDCYVRMYDRRMLKTCMLSQSSEREPVDPACVQYFAPGHLALDNSAHTNFKLATTYISFNAGGTEMLVNVGGEQIYLFDVNSSRRLQELQVPRTYVPNGRRRPVYKKCCGGNGGGGDEECACFYMERAATCYQRKWMGDLYQAARDYFHVLSNWSGQKAAHAGLIRCLIALKWDSMARQWLDDFTARYPCDVGQVGELKEQLDDGGGGRSSSSSSSTAKDQDDGDGKEERFYNPFRKVEELEQAKRLESVDFERRFLGHCNTTTDIKEANFLGEDGNFVCAGSDEGIIFVWERKRSRIVTALFGDVSIVNCIQPHPTACFLASSGIDTAVKLWSPMPEEDDGTNPRLVKDIDAVVEANQHRMLMDPFESMLVNMGYRIPPGFNVGTMFQELPSCRTS